MGGRVDRAGLVSRRGRVHHLVGLRCDREWRSHLGGGVFLRRWHFQRWGGVDHGSDRAGAEAMSALAELGAMMARIWDSNEGARVIYVNRREFYLIDRAGRTKRQWRRFRGKRRGAAARR